MLTNLKFIVGMVVGLLLLVLLGYWAISSIESGGIHVDKETQKELMAQNEELRKEVEELKNELRLLQPEPETPAAETPIEEETPAPSSPSKHQSLISELEQLVKDKIQMKQGSKGTRVGTVQEFLNVYNNTSKKIDNDYGKGAKADIAAFQKAVGITADGEAGPTTFQKMIDWLKTNG